MGADAWEGYNGTGSAGDTEAGGAEQRLPQTFGIGTPDGGPPRRPGKWLLGGAGRYNKASPQVWIQGVGDYVAGRTSEMDRVLDWVESRSEEITQTVLASA